MKLLGPTTNMSHCPTANSFNGDHFKLDFFSVNLGKSISSKGWVTEETRQFEEEEEEEEEEGKEEEEKKKKKKRRRFHEEEEEEVSKNYSAKCMADYQIRCVEPTGTLFRAVGLVT